MLGSHNITFSNFGYVFQKRRPSVRPTLNARCRGSPCKVSCLHNISTLSVSIFFPWLKSVLLREEQETRMLFRSLVALGLVAQQISAFPSYLSESLIQIRKEAESRLEARCRHLEKREAAANAEAAPAGCPFSKEKRQAPGVTPPFNAEQQYVSNTGAHKFVPPSGNDQRGPCEILPFLSSREARD